MRWRGARLVTRTRRPKHPQGIRQGRALTLQENLPGLLQGTPRRNVEHREPFLEVNPPVSKIKT